jgi:hypothetical protein
MQGVCQASDKEGFKHLTREVSSILQGMTQVSDRAGLKHLTTNASSTREVAIPKHAAWIFGSSL